MAEETTNGRVKIPAPVFYLIVAILGWGLSAFVGYTAAADSMNARVSVLEEQVRSMRSDVTDIRTDVKTLLERR